MVEKRLGKRLGNESDRARTKPLGPVKEARSRTLQHDKMPH